MQAAIYGIEGFELTAGERSFFRDAEPAGFILFRRNCETQDQLLRLTDSLREISGRGDVPILIDQEGGRVARMRPPKWPAFPAAEKFANLYRAAPSSAIEAVRSNARALALMLRSCGINVNALPLLDVRQEGATDIIGDRADGDDGACGLHDLGLRAPREPVARRDPRHHTAADRLRWLADERRSRHGSAEGGFREPRGRSGSSRMRCCAALLGQDG
jgi:hypothetical protein